MNSVETTTYRKYYNYQCYGYNKKLDSLSKNNTTEQQAIQYAIDNNYNTIAELKTKYNFYNNYGDYQRRNSLYNKFVNEPHRHNLYTGYNQINIK